MRDVTLLLCGDVMTGRGVDQILPRPAPPRLREPAIGDARDYVRLAEARSGPIPRPVPLDYVWGEALPELRRRAPDARVVNLETAVTTSEDWEPKGINYRMSPANVGCLTAAGVDCCALANNHVLDFGPAGLADTLAALAAAGIACAGAGLDAEQASAPAVLALPGGDRLLVFSAATASSGVPESWAAGERRPGVWLLEDLGEETLSRLRRRLRQARRPGDVVVVSLHWGGNWGYDVPAAHRSFAQALIDGGADVVHGHSSHHPKGVEVHHGKPILYGCGDLINDYEGISGYEEFRAELGFLYFVTLEAGSRRLRRLELVPTRLERLRLRRAGYAEAAWLHETLSRASEPFKTRVRRLRDGTLAVSGS